MKREHKAGLHQISLLVALLFSGFHVAWASEEQSELLYTRGLIPFQEEHYEEALPLFQQAAAEESPYYLAFYYLGVTYGKLGQYSEAVPALEKAVDVMARTPKARPGLALAHQDLAVTFYHLQRYPAALGHLKKAEQTDPQNGFIQYYKGVCHYALGDHTAAIAALQRAVRLEPKLRPQASYYVGLAHLARGEPQEAVQALEQTASDSAGSQLGSGALELVAKVSDRLERERPEKIWELRFGVGAAYDSNVILQPDRGPSAGQIANEEDFLTEFRAGGTIDVWRRSSTYLAGNYDFHQTLHSDLTDFNLQAHRARLTGGWSPVRPVTLGIEGGFNDFRVGDHDYLHESYGTLSVGLLGKPWAYTFLSYSLAHENYLVDFFDPERDGIRQTGGLRQYFLLKGFARYFFLGYQYSKENPSSFLGNDFQHSGNQAELGIRSFLGWKTTVELTYFFRNDDYPFANSRTNFTSPRHDNSHTVLVQLRKSLTRSLQLNVRYLGTINNSNIEVFKYNRNVASAGFEVVF